MPAAFPSRDDAGTTPPEREIICPVCATSFVPVGRQRHCSTVCRKRAFRRRRARAAAALPAKASRREHTVYECDECGGRMLGEQRCADCGRFGRSAGLGGDCPHCGEPVTVGELGLLEVPR